MFVNFIKKVLEAAKKNQSQGTASSPTYAEDENSLEELLEKDDFLNEFISPQNVEESSPALQEGSRLVTTMSDLMEKKKKSFSKEQSDFKKFVPVDFKDTLKGTDIPEMEKGPVKIDLSKDNIQKAFIMKEILSPPAAIRGYDKDLFSSLM